MSGNPFSSLVGRKLAYARALARLADNAVSDNIARGALCEGALQHLHSAYLAFVREIGATYQLSDPGALDSASQLRDALRQMGKVPNEASELCDLEADPASWLAALLSLQRGAEGRPSGPAMAAPTIEGLIQIKRVDQSTEELGPEVLRALLKSFVDLVDRHRETMVEY